MLDLLFLLIIAGTFALLAALVAAGDRLVGAGVTADKAAGLES